MPKALSQPAKGSAGLLLASSVLTIWPEQECAPVRPRRLPCLRIQLILSPAPGQGRRWL
jgi:hypothetical protein